MSSVAVAKQIPEVGQLVEVRRRQWIVANVEGAAFDSASDQSLITLASVDEDSPGEELQVIWQLEPGARIVEKAGLPGFTGCDSDERLEAFLDAVRWGAATNADKNLLQAPFRSGVSIEDFQLDPVVRAIDMARVNLLIADDVGLGKTIEAGLVIQEMLVRHRARTVLVVCPSSLQVKWQTEMHEKFGLEFRIVDTEFLKKLRREQGIHANPWTAYPRLIASIDWMKAGEALRLMKDVLPPHMTYPRKFDILVVDEAHNVAPAFATHHALESQRTRLIRSIAPHFEHRLFLSATPHNGYQSSFTALLELLDDQRFSRNVMPDEKQLQRVMIRRLKSDLVDENGEPIYAKRKIKSLPVIYTPEEKEAHSLLQAYAKSRAASVAGTRAAFGSEFVHNLLKKRLFSSPAGFATTLGKHRDSLAGKRSERSKSSLDERILRKAIARTEEDYADDALLEEAIDEAVEESSAAAVPLNDEQKQILAKLTSWAETARHRPDSKATAIIEWLKTHLKPGGNWNDSRVILFTEYRATHSWLQEILTNQGFGGNRMMIMHGGIDSEERQKVTAAFQANPSSDPVRILLATDAASEGIDLQNHCQYLIHVEIPWNPNVMEQRNGRIDRHGQKHKEVFIWHPVGTAGDSSKVGELEGDHVYLMKAVEKVEAIREDLGSVGPVIAQQIVAAMSGKRIDLDTRDAEAKAAKARRFVAAEKRIQEKVATLHKRLMEAREDFHLSPDHISKAVQVAMELAERPALIPVSLPDMAAGSAFEVPMMAGSWGRASVGLSHPHTGERRPITFDHDAAKGRDDVVLAHLNHRLVQMCLRLLRAEVWAPDDTKSLHRVSIRVSADPTLTVPVAAVWSRLVITGGNYHRLHEELTLSGGELKPSGFSRITTLGRLESLVEDASTPTDAVSSAAQEMLSPLYAKAQDSILAAIEGRSKDRLKFLENSLARRKQADIDDITTVLTDLEQAITHEIEDSKAVQLELWAPDERQQLRRDLDALHARLKRIPEERDHEVTAIAQRYADYEERTFPVAVIFVIPQNFVKGACP
jgi:superfamily II DNA or RNA helicase